MDMAMDVDIESDMDKPVKGGKKGKKEKNGGKAGKGKRAEESRQREKSSSSCFFLINLFIYFDSLDSCY